MIKPLLADLAAVFLAVSLCVPCLAQRTKRDRPREGSLKVGDTAPDFNLKRLHGKGRVKLSDFKGKKPVVLIFGSYT